MSSSQAIRLWLSQQGLLQPRAHVSLTKKRLERLLETVGGIQLDPINVVDRAHRLTLWSRFGSYKRADVERWIYRDRMAIEYWVHEASLMPRSHLPLARRRMLEFPPAQWHARAWWPVYNTSPASKRRVLRRLSSEGPLESADFEAQPKDRSSKQSGGTMPLTKEDGRSLKLLWHAGRVAVHSRRNGRCVYDLAENVYPAGDVATKQEFEASWLLRGLRGNGLVSERHLTNYITGPELPAARKKAVIARALKQGDVVEVRVKDLPGSFFVQPDHLASIESLPEPEGTNLICPFDSLLWQRGRAEDLMGFNYRIEIYVPPAKRQFGYYVLPIMHRGQLVGRLDPKLHRDKGLLEIKGIFLEGGFRKSKGFERGLAKALNDLAGFLDVDGITVPRKWSGLDL